MLPVGWLVVAVIAAILVSMWVTFTLTRLDRLHARVDAASAALDAQLVRRAAALLHLAETPDSGVPQAVRAPSERVAQAALAAEGVEGALERQVLENDVGRMIGELARSRAGLAAAAAAELDEGVLRVQVARRFYNDAVRDTRTLRSRRLPRLLHLAGHRAVPDFFDIDDTVAGLTIDRDAPAGPPGESRPA